MIGVLEISEIVVEKERYLWLLLIGDEQLEMIERYLGRGRLFIGSESGTVVSCCLVTEEGGDVVEVKNLAVISEFRRRGIGRMMLRYAEGLYPGKLFQLGTGETPSTLQFYKKCGYEFSHRIPDFFTDNYDHPIVEEGVVLRDMIYLRHRVEDLRGENDG